MEKLQLRAPTVSKRDRQCIQTAMQSGKISSKIKDIDVCDKVQMAILNWRQLIPTIETLFKNLGYLEICAKILRNKIIDTNSKTTIRQAIFNCYHPPEDTSTVEVSENRFDPAAISISGPARAMTQLWLFCMRHFSHLSNIAPKKEAGQGIPPVMEPNPVYQYRLAFLAQRVGIKTQKVGRTLQKNFEEEATRRFLAQVRPAPFNEYGPAGMEENIRNIINTLPSLNPNASREPEEPPTSSESEEPLDRRTGRPYENSYKVLRIESRSVSSSCSRCSSV